MIFLRNIFLIFLLGCLNKNDVLEFRGLGTGLEIPGATLQSSIKNLKIEGEQIVLEGDNLDLIENLNIFSEQSLTLDSFQNVMSSEELIIISKTKNKIIASAKKANITLLFDGRYDLSIKDKDIPDKKFFPFVIVRKEGRNEQFEETKVEETLDVSKGVLVDNANDRDVIVYSKDKNQWTPGVITGQIEYLGNWNPFFNQANAPKKFSGAFSLDDSGTVGDIFELLPGMYFTIAEDCIVDNGDPSLDPNTLCDPSSNLIPTRGNYFAADWLVYDGSKWHYISNKGEVESFNRRTGIIESCPGANCPNQFDYAWGLLDKSNSKIEDIDDLNIGNKQDGLILVFDGAQFVAREDKTGLTEVRSNDIKDNTLVDVDFASGIQIKKFEGLQEELDRYVDSSPSSGVATLTGDLDFKTSKLTGVNEIVVKSGSFNPDDTMLELKNLDLDAKQDLISTDFLTPGKKYYLSSDSSNSIEWKLLNTINVKNGLTTNFYFDEQKALESKVDEDLIGTPGEIKALDSLKDIFKKLGKKREDFLQGNLAVEILPQAITIDKLADPVDDVGNPLEGYLHYDASLKEWSLLNVSGFNFVGDLDPTGSLTQLNNSYNSGDFFVISKDGTSSISIAGSTEWNSGDWIVYNGPGDWKKIDYQGKIISVFSNTGKIEADSGQYDWNQVVIRPFQIDSSDPKTKSSLTDIEDVDGSPTDGQFLSWNGTKWVPKDDAKNNLTSANNITGLLDQHFSPTANIAQSKINNFQSELSSKIELANPGSLTGSLDFNSNKITNLNKLVVGADELTFSDFLQNLEDLKTGLTSKMDKFSAASDPSFLNESLSFEKRDATKVTESLTGGKYFNEARVLETKLRASDVDGKNNSGGSYSVSDSLYSSMSLGELLDLLQYKVAHRYDSVSGLGTDSLKDGSIEPKHFIPFEDTTGASKGDYFYFNGTSWELRSHSTSFEYLGALPNATSSFKSDAKEGDYYIADSAITLTLDGSSENIIEGDWVMFLTGVWKRLSNSTPVSSFSIGQDSGGGLYVPAIGDYKISEIEMTSSLLSDITDVEGTPAKDDILKWTGSKWSFVQDLAVKLEINGADISGMDLTSDHFDLTTKIPFSKIIDYPENILKIESSTSQGLFKDADMNEYKILNVNLINGIDFNKMNDDLNTFVQYAPTLISEANFPVNSSSGDTNKYVINDSGIRIARQLTYEDIDLTGESLEFYSSDTVFNTPLDNFIPHAGGSKIVSSNDNSASALSKIEATANENLTPPTINVKEGYDIGKVLASHDKTIFISSFIVFRLPASNTISDGFSVSFKAENGPLIILNPEPNKGWNNDKSKAMFLGLKKGAFAKLIYTPNSGWIIDENYGELFYEATKKNNYFYCPTGYARIYGNNILGTGNFCVEIVPKSYPTTSSLNSLNASCGTYGGHVMTLAEFQTIYWESLRTAAGADGILSSAEFNTWQNTRALGTIGLGNKEYKSNINGPNTFGWTDFGYCTNNCFNLYDSVWKQRNIFYNLNTPGIWKWAKPMMGPIRIPVSYYPWTGYGFNSTQRWDSTWRAPLYPMSSQEILQHTTSSPRLDLTGCNDATSYHYSGDIKKVMTTKYNSSFQLTKFSSLQSNSFYSGFHKPACEITPLNFYTQVPMSFDYSTTPNKFEPPSWPTSVNQTYPTTSSGGINLTVDYRVDGTMFLYPNSISTSNNATLSKRYTYRCVIPK